MAPNSNNEKELLFHSVQSLGVPKIRPVITKGRRYVVTQFIVPGLEIEKSSIARYQQLAQQCGQNIVEVLLLPVTDKKSNATGTQVEIGFQFASVDEPTDHDKARNESLQNYVKFLGLLSFATGKSLPGKCLQTNLAKTNGGWSKELHPECRASVPSVEIHLPSWLDGRKSIPESVFTALLWLRRGLAERDPIYTFSSLMVCLEILARHLLTESVHSSIRSVAGTIEENKQLGPTALVRKLVTDLLGGETKTVNTLITTRNAVVAHGGRHITADVLVSLTELKMDAAEFAFKALKLAFGVKQDEPPFIDSAFFVTDALMYWE